MPRSIPSPSLRIPLEPLTHAAFTPFGTVTSNPSHSPSPSTPGYSSTPLSASVSANQGTATKYAAAAPLTDFYAYLSPSRKPSSPQLSLFVCHPRRLRQLEPVGPIEAFEADYGAEDEMVKRLFDVRVLERHPYTSQTFIPMGLGAEGAHTHYIVIVAPTLPVAGEKRENEERYKPYPTPPRDHRASNIELTYERARPAPYWNENSPQPSGAASGSQQERPRGTGLPDLANARAFLATGRQAVTYAAGTWHAPMAVLGKESVDFAVVQWANAVASEDCQEVELRGQGVGGEGVSVEVEFGDSGEIVVAGLGGVKAKL
ncbi:hypothetical protein K402DRAFT_392060 [Aulographum hederae CBS 113979]|uniref:Ureidoglycolate hydrolase n=1 Tax=Aulographum hederae CBS 113979 TaxID=1176131 RepID=A0A6G1H5M9_9PEZI|nr:hypothetical protein K402DRAFT_392060 [Aulographum hederae CBS 113979]